MDRLDLPVGPTIVWVLLNVLTVYRLARIVTVDTISQPWRRWLTRRYAAGWMLDLLMCPYCLAVWFSAAAGVLTWQVPTVWFWVALTGGIAGGADLLLNKTTR